MKPKHREKSVRKRGGESLFIQNGDLGKKIPNITLSVLQKIDARSNFNCFTMSLPLKKK